MNKTKRSIVFSVVSLVLCVAMLAGSTFAWFTDSVTSVNNIIKTGNLDLKVLWTDDLEGGNWNDAEDSEAGPVFSYDNWEPGYTSIRYVKIVNAGSLAFKYSLNLIPDGDAGILGDVIDVYYVEDASSNITKLDGLTKAGVLNDVINKNISAGGVLLPKGETKTGFYTEEIVIAIALHMHEDAGNEYQNKSVGASFAIQLLATQYDYESDDLGDGYDQGSQWPNDVVVGGSSASAPVTPVDGKVPAGGLNLVSEDGEIGATIPEGVAVVPGTTNMTLTIGSVSKSEANITLDENEAALSIDVHVSGVAENNTVPMAIYRKELLPVGLNMGNYRFYHVEDENTVEMVLLEDGATPVHNNYEYDPATGDVVLYLASFSEVAMVAEPAKWEGNRDYSWYDNAVAPIAEGDPDYIIANADQLAAFGAIVGGMDGQTQNSFDGKVVKLVADINLGDRESENNPSIIFYPIGYYNSEGTYERTNTAITSGLRNFEGTFDGNGNTISNFYQNTWEMKGDHDWYSPEEQYYRDGMGLFGRVYGGTVKNLTVDHFSSDGEIATTGVIAAYAEGATFTNIAITNCNPRVYNIGNGGIVGCVGWYAKEAGLKTTFTNITVDNSNKISALWGSYDVACGGIVGQYYPTSGQTSAGTPKNAGIHFENCHVSAVMDVYNDVCANYQYYAYRYTGMMIGSVRENETIDGHVYPKMDGITASGCTVHFGDWNDYYYCELVANSLASYTHDHQMSRLTQVASVDVENKTVTDLDGKTTAIPASGRVNYVVVKAKDANGMWIHGDGHDYAECYHFVNGVQHFHDVADTDNPNPTETVDGVEGVLKEDKQLVYREFNQLFTGYGWGVTSKGLADFEGTIILDNVYEGEPVTKFESKFTGDFLYRVGNAVDSTVSVGTLFQAIDSSKYPIANSGVHVKVEAVYENQNVGGTFKANATDWTKGTIQFYGTGIVKVTIQDYIYCTPTTIILEVVDAKNTTTASFSGNTVLLQDVSTSSTLSATGVVYGNGFTVNMENAPISEKNGAVFHLYDGTILKNLSIVGKEFTTVATNVNDTNYGVSAVRAWGTVTIENCYISGCRSAVSVTGNELTIKDSVIANGVYSNIDFRSGVLNLHNVTTINQPHDVNGTTVVGLGIVGNMTASAGRKINITGSLTQYNWISQADCSNIKASGLDNMFKTVFTDANFAPIRYNYDGVEYVNTGILSLSASDFNESGVTGIPTDYQCLPATGTIGNTSMNGFVWTYAKDGTLTDDDMQYHDKVYEWTPTEQGTSYIPSGFDYLNAGLTAENGVVQIEYESGSSYTLTADTIMKLFAATKYGQNLSYKVSMNGTDYTNKDIVFNEAASSTYTITFTVTDNLVYDKDGKLTNTSYSVEKQLKIFATVVDKTADAPTFIFYYGTNGSASAGTPHTTQPTNSYTSTIKQVGEAYYIMPNVSATTANAIGSQTVNGETIYYPIVDGINVRSGSAMDYDFTRYYPIFKAVKISDNGTEYSYSGTIEMPATVTWVDATIDSGNGASGLNDGFGLYNNQYLSKIQKKAGDAESGGTSVVKFSYTALDGNTYYYYVGFRFYDENEGGICVTGDTLVALADGTQKRIDEVTYEDQLLVWNFFTGTYDAAPSAIIFYHGDDTYRVLKLNFADGTTVKAINNHGFYDVEEDKFVFIDEFNVQEYIGHHYVKVDGSSTTMVELVSYEIIEEYTGSYSIQTAMHNNFMTEGMFSITMPHYEGWFDYFEIGEGMKYDEEKMQADIEKYGLYTYEDFAEYVTYEQFIAFNGPYLKVLVARGVVTYDQIIELISTYVNPEQ